MIQSVYLKNEIILKRTTFYEKITKLLEKYLDWYCYFYVGIIISEWIIGQFFYFVQAEVMIYYCL
jgi:hypothetical protein